MSFCLKTKMKRIQEDQDSVGGNSKHHGRAKSEVLVGRFLRHGEGHPCKLG